MAKIAVDFEDRRARPESSPALPAARVLAQGEGWAVSEVVCGLGPRDRPFEERHSRTAIAIVVSGTFQYRSRTGSELMTPGSLLLASPGQYFECGHEHATGDRCVSFSYTPEFFERLAADAGARGGRSGFQALRLPPIRPLSPLIARAGAALDSSALDSATAAETAWEELGLQLAARAVQLDRGIPAARVEPHPGAVARVTRVVRMLERYPDSPHNLAGLAREARLSRYHFLRVFEALTGVTPHQYLLRGRLRRAAQRLSAETTRILDIALECGFGDVSNFNRTFRAEFGVTPRRYRAQTRRWDSPAR